jgi:hypothetical protein
MKIGKAALLGAAGAAIVFASATAASAAVTTITFDDRISAGTIDTLGFIEDGEYGFPSPTADFQTWGANNAFNADPGGATLFSFGQGTNTLFNTVTTVFSVLSIDVGDEFNGAFGDIPSSIVFGGLDIHGNAIATQTVALSGAPGLTTITLGAAFKNIVEFEWTGSDQIDNLVVSDERFTGGVPEPASWALMIAGFGMAGAMMRRRRRLAAI